MFATKELKINSRSFRLHAFPNSLFSPTIFFIMAKKKKQRNLDPGFLRPKRWLEGNIAMTEKSKEPKKLSKRTCLRQGLWERLNQQKSERGMQKCQWGRERNSKVSGHTFQKSSGVTLLWTNTAVWPGSDHKNCTGKPINSFKDCRLKNTQHRSGLINSSPQAKSCLLAFCK